MNDDQDRLAPGGNPAPNVTREGVGPLDGDPAPRQGGDPDRQRAARRSSRPPRRPRYVFLAVVSAVVFALDVGSKAWAEMALSAGRTHPRVLVPGHLSLALAYNEGGAWGLLQGADAAIRKPFFLVVSVIAIGFIVSLYRRLSPEQWALRWGLPMVLGGALGNLSDRIARTGVVDFILYRAEWVGTMNRAIARVVRGWTITEFWPTFNVADIAICVGVGLMAVDMLTSKRSSTDRGGAPGEHAAEDDDPQSAPPQGDSASHGLTPSASEQRDAGSSDEDERIGTDPRPNGQSAVLLMDR
ncbi:MAG: signal peptidase II [Polyangiaceae bacterium]|nr:signal peptidase II [Polyangiaceae bacterium]